MFPNSSIVKLELIILKGLTVFFLILTLAFGGIVLLTQKHPWCKTQSVQYDEIKERVVRIIEL